MTRLLVALAGASLAAGCIAGQTPKDRFFRLEAPPAAQTLARPLFPGVLEVERPGADALVRERQILRATAGSAEVMPYGYSLWIDSPTLLVQRTLADHLRAAGVAEQVVTPDMGVDEQWIVKGQLQRMEQVLGGDPQVRVELQLSVARRDRGTLVMQRTYRVLQPAASDSIGDAVSAFQAALADIYGRFVADLSAAR